MADSYRVFLSNIVTLQALVSEWGDAAGAAHAAPAYVPTEHTQASGSLCFTHLAAGTEREEAQAAAQNTTVAYGGAPPS